MSKSKYPNQIDTSVELPHVRNNILQMGSEAINSLRSAVVNIEKTLGINPQGSPSQTLSNRLDRSLDESGNIRPDAISKLGLLSGPITDRDVSDSANIKESKIKLDYPTSLLYSEISGLFGEVKTILSQLIEINKTLSSHIDQNAINKHLAKAIMLEEVFAQGSDISTKSISESNMQEAIKKIVTGHINYSGQNISSSNNSHTASQIYFDNSNTDFSSDNIQSTLEEIDLFTDTSVKDHQDILHGNVLLSSDYGSLDLNEYNSEVVYNGEASGIRYNTNSDSQFATFSVPSTNFSVDKSDYLIAQVGGSEEKFQVNSVSTDGVSTSVEVFGAAIADFNDNIVIHKEEKKDLPESAMLVSFINNPVLTSKNIAEIISPNSTYIVSNKLNYSLVTSSASNINVIVNDITYNISCHLPSVSEQTPYTISEAINERASELNATFASTVIFKDGFSEIIIYSRVPNTLDKIHTIKVTRGSDDGIDFLGFSSIENLVISGDFSNNYLLNGIKYSQFSNKVKTSSFTISSGTNIVASPNQDLRLLKIKKNDILHIYNSSNSGSYIIKKVTQNQITLDTTKSFVAESGEPVFLIMNNTVSLSSENFKKLSGNYKSMIGDIFVDQNNEVFSDTRLEYSAHLVSGDSLIKILDFDGHEEEFTLNVDAVDSETIRIYIDEIYYDLSNVENYGLKIKSAKLNISIDIWVSNSSSVITYINSLGSNLSMQCAMNKSVSENSNLFVSRFNYNNFNGRFSGGSSVYNKKLFDRGSISYKNISSLYKEKVIDKQFMELRSTGVAEGLKAHNLVLNADTSFSVDISGGVCYIEGKRFDIKSMTISSSIQLSSSDKVFLYIDTDGVVRFELASYSASGRCYFPKNSDINIVIATIEYDSVSAKVFDLRFNISDLDKKSFGPIVVSKEKGFGHTDNLKDALELSKRFYEVYNNLNSIDILLKSGNHKVIVDTGLEFPSTTSVDFDSSSVNQTLITALAESGVWFDFPVRVIGEGNNSSLEVIFKYSNLDGWGNGNSSDKLIVQKGFIGLGGTNLKTTPSYPNAETMPSGKILFRDINFLNTSVVLYDTDIIVDSDNNIISGTVSFENCRFEYNIIDESRSANKPGIIYNRQELDDSDRFIGGLSVKDCYFKNSNMLFTSPDNLTYYLESNDLMELSITGNTIDTLGSQDMIETTGILSKFLTTTSKYGPKISGNKYIGSIGRTTSQSTYWVSTVPSGLNIHGDIKVGNISNSSTSNSTVSNFYTNVYLDSGYSLTLNSGNLNVGGISNLGTTVIFGNGSISGDLNVVGSISSESSISSDETITAESNIVSNSGYISADLNISSENGKMDAHLTSESGGSIFYGKGSALSSPSSDHQARSIKRKNSYICTTVNLSNPGGQLNELDDPASGANEGFWDPMRKLPAIDHGTVTKSHFCTFFPGLTYSDSTSYWAWAAMSDTSTFTKENFDGGSADAPPPYKGNTISVAADASLGEDSDDPTSYWPRECFMVAPYDGYIDKIIIKAQTSRKFLLRKIMFRNNLLNLNQPDDDAWQDDFSETSGLKSNIMYAHDLNITGDPRFPREESVAKNPGYWYDMEEYVARLNNESAQFEAHTNSGGGTEYLMVFDGRGDTVVVTNAMLKQQFSFKAGDSISVVPILHCKEGVDFSYDFSSEDREFYKYGFHITYSIKYFTRLDVHTPAIKDNFSVTQRNSAAQSISDSVGIENVGPSAISLSISNGRS
jgi:hypothetical protein